LILNSIREPPWKFPLARSTASPAAPVAISVKRGPYAKSSQTRERILAAAFEVAGEVGLHRVAVAAIADRAGVAVGNLHYHFGSRDELLQELMKSVQLELLNVVENAIADVPGYLAAEEASIRAYLAFVHRNPAYVRLAEESRLHQPEFYREGITTWLRLIREGLEEAGRNGEFRPMDSDEIASVAHFILGARYFLDQMIESVDGRPYPGDEAVVAGYMAFVRNGLMKQETP
jgi:AcrR family transcriptional regulator